MPGASDNIWEAAIAWDRERRADPNNKQLIVAFMAEFKRRMELQEVTPSTVCEMGVFITTELIKKKGWDQRVSTEESS